MTKLSWGESGEHFYEAGVDRGVFYSADGAGFAWNGLISVEEAPSDTDVRPVYIDGQKQSNSHSDGSFAAKLEAYTYPREFSEYDGSPEISPGGLYDQSLRKSFGLSYRTQVGNEFDGTDHGYKIHIVYNALADPTDRDYETVGELDDPTIFSWDLTTTPVLIPGARPGSHLIIDSSMYPWVVTPLEDILYGTDEIDPRLPSIPELLQIFEDAAILKITDNGDGTWTAETREGYDDIITMLDATTFQISWPSAIFIDSESYTLQSL